MKPAVRSILHRLITRGYGGQIMNHTADIATINAGLDQVVKELQTQLTRIGQIQQQLRLDHHLAKGESAAAGQKRRRTDQTEH
jgi:hypothetical protein